MHRNAEWSFAYPNTQTALSLLHLVHGLEPSHLLFFKRHRSQALHTLFLMPSEAESVDAVRCGGAILLTGVSDECDRLWEWYATGTGC